MILDWSWEAFNKISVPEWEGGRGLEEAKLAATPALLVPQGVWEGQVASWVFTYLKYRTSNMRAHANF